VIDRNLNKSRILFIKPVEIMYWVSILAITVLALLLPIDPRERRFMIILTSTMVVFGLILFRWLIPRYAPKPWIDYLTTSIVLIFICLYNQILQGQNIHLEILYLVVIATSGVISGPKIALYTAVLSAVIETSATILTRDLSSGLVITLGLQNLILLLAGYFISAFTGIIQLNITQSNNQNRYLSTLLQVGMLTSKPEDLKLLLSRIAEMITRDVPVSSCQICLLNSTGDQLATYGAYPLRPLIDWNVEIGQSYLLKNLPKLQKALNINQPVVIQQDELSFSENNEYLHLFSKDVKTICILPLITQDAHLGLISVGEVRRWEREPFTQDKIDLLQTLSTQVAAAIHNAQLYQESQRQAQRLSVINKVSQAIGSTIELDDLLELIYEQLSIISPSDTYFVSLYDEKDDTQDIRILIDAGQRFPHVRVPVGEGFSSYVIKNRKPLLLHHISEDWDSLVVKPVQMGQDRMSESWLGVPMIIGDRCLGLLAIASYRPYAFNEDDMTLLTNIAAQAVLALDNAHQHAEVKEKARRDSLTNAYNHGTLLMMLEQEVEAGRKTGAPVSLIMLDVDYFKDYNDRYGHVIGDQVLCSLVNAIQAHVKESDIVGRWGGEEFSVGLPGVSKKQSYEVANRIRKSLAKIVLHNKAGEPIPSPTISQGIATFPQDANDTAQLVNIADMALYQAKESGRNQIVVANPPLSFLDQLEID
jgi:diguanylate cyclase (GGDEF)-like protein